jgi:dTDP-4-dehydrorhamnose 3,5-epimerase
MELIPTALTGCYEIRPVVTKDARGSFVKTFNAEHFLAHGLYMEWSEEYYSTSRRDVVRGMHCQVPPHEHDKLVCCMQGKALDVVIDLRKESPTYGRYLAIELDSQHGLGLLIPKGMAHGFLALTENVLMSYKVSSSYNPSSDTGIRWDSFGFGWGIDQPIVSDRDRSLPALKNFKSPF